MLSKQTDGTVLGFTPAWVIAYTKPGASGQIAYNINTQFGDQLNMVTYTADRYESDNALTANWDTSNIITLGITGVIADGYEVVISYAPRLSAPFRVGDQVLVSSAHPNSFNGNFIVLNCSPSRVTVSSNNTDLWKTGGTVSSVGNWVPSPPQSATFDIDYHYIVSDEYPAYGGTGYTVGTVLKITGTQLGGTSPSNDCTITVNTVDTNGAIVEVFYYGTASLLASGDTFNNITATVISGSGSGALWNISVVPGVETVFDGGSITFNDPANMDTNTNVYDKYLMFPDRNIIGSPLQTTVMWINDNTSTVTWINSSNQPVNWLNNNA
jgi:hypothetical protein